jgi:hypothetical protein
MEIILSLAFGLWIIITAFVYRAFTTHKHKGEDDK